MRVGIIGRTHLLLKSANLIVRNGHSLAFVYTCKAEDFYTAKEQDFEDLAIKNNCPFFNDLKIEHRTQELLDCKADICLSVNWLNVLTERTFSLFPFGVLNAHSGDLPRYRGNACPNWAIINHEKVMGLTVHKMDDGLDSGPYI